MTSAPSRRRKLSTSVAASNPSELVDKYMAAVDEYEKREDREGRPAGATATFEEIARRWEAFAAAAAAIEHALRDPLAPGACVVLIAAQRLGERMDELCVLVTSVGEAIDSRGDPRRLEILRQFGVPMSLAAKR